jgi:hypothetical protein
MNDYGWSHLTRSDKAAILRGVGTGDCFGGPYHVEIQPGRFMSYQMLPEPLAVNATT